MGGPITDLPVRACRVCGVTWMEDANMYDEPDRCPGCGACPEDGVVEDFDIDLDV